MRTLSLTCPSGMGGFTRPSKTSMFRISRLARNPQFGRRAIALEEETFILKAILDEVGFSSLKSDSTSPATRSPVTSRTNLGEVTRGGRDHEDEEDCAGSAFTILNY